jgi:hypothetical protein
MAESGYEEDVGADGSVNDRYSVPPILCQP